MYVYFTLTALDAKLHSSKSEVVGVAEIDTLLDCETIIIWLFVAHDTPVRVVASPMSKFFLKRGAIDDLHIASIVLPRCR